MIKSKLNKNAFTLIELLAIIVILAIIAVITVPIILNIIENSKKGAAIDSAYGYKKAVSDHCLSDTSLDSNNLLDGTYNVSFLEEYGINVNGNKPTDGWVKINKGIVTDYSFIIGDYVVTSYDDEATASKGEIMLSSNPIIKRSVDGVEYYDTSWIKNTPIYYNPIDGKICNTSSDTTDVYKIDNSKNAYNGVNPGENQSSCLKWFAYSKNSDGTVNLLLDHNTTATLAWNTVASSGPSDDFLQSLYDGTIGWGGVPSRTDSYDFNVRNRVYSLDYSGYKARILSAEEIALITENFDFDTASSADGQYYFDTFINERNQKIDSKDESKYSWLFTNTNGCEGYGCQTKQSGSAGYWTSSAAPRATTFTWHVRNTGGLFHNGLYYSSSGYYGIRPVISVNL